MKIAVIICTSPGREHNLEGCLQVLARQSRRADEIIIADDGSRGGQDVATRFKHLPIQYLWRPNDCGLALSRNLGAAATSADLLVFLDTDVLLNPRGLKAYAEYLQEFPKHVLYGYFGYQQEYLAPSFFLPEREVLWCDSRYEHYAPEGLKPARNMMRFPHEWAWGGNFALMRSVYEAVGGFDARFRGWGGEDLDFASRLLAQHFQIHFFLDAWAEQQTHRHDEPFHVLPPEEREVEYEHHYDEANYRVQCLHSPQGWAELSRVIFEYYTVRGRVVLKED